MLTRSISKEINKHCLLEIYSITESVNSREIYLCTRVLEYPAQMKRLINKIRSPNTTTSSPSGSTLFSPTTFQKPMEPELPPVSTPTISNIETTPMRTKSRTPTPKKKPSVPGLLWTEDRTVKSAVIHATVNVLILAGLVVMYYNYILLGPYFSVIFWAVLVSIPLHSLKRTLVELITLTFLSDPSHPSPGLLSICTTLIVFVLKFIFGPAWSLVSSGPSWYFSQVNRIRDYQYRRQKQLARRILHPGIVSASLSVSKIDLKQDSFATTSDSTALLLFQEKLLENISTNPSGIYFIYLFRACGWYILLYTLGCLSIYNWWWIILITISAAVIHMLCIVLMSAYHIYLSPFLTRIYSIIKQVGTWIDNHSWNIFSKVSTKVSNLLFSSKKIYTEIKEDMRHETVKQAHTVVSGMILVVFVFCSLLMSTFLLFQFAHEAHLFVDKTITVVNHTVLHNDYLKDLQVREQIHGTLNDLTSKGISWADSQLNEKFPGYNLSVNTLYDKALQTYSFVFQSKKTSRLSVLAGRRGISSNDDKFTILLNKQFPETIRLCREAFDGNFSVLLNFASVKTSFGELKSGLIKTTQALFQNDREYIEGLINSIEENLLYFGQWALSNSTTIFSYASLFILSLFNFFLYSFNLLAQAILFFVTLYYLLLPEQDVLGHLGQLLIHVDTKQVFKTSVEKAINAVFITTIKMFTFHSLFTWLTFNVFDIPFVYITTFATGFIAIVPITSPTWLVLPGCIELYVRGQPISAIIFLLMHYMVSWFVDPAIYRDIPDSHPYFSALSIVLGLWAFGWQGIVLGPLLACLPVVAFHLYSEMIK